MLSGHARCLLTTACCLLVVSCATPGPAPGLVVADVTVISPHLDAPLEHAFVRIVDGQIAEVSRRRLRGEREIDGTGRYLIPGLIDSHVHLAAAPTGFPAPMTAEQAAANPEVVAAALAQEPRSYLFHGFTTVLDLIAAGDRIARWNALEDRPDAYFCGGAAMSGGKIQIIQTPYFSYDQTGRLDGEGLPPGEAVARIAADGAICVKTFYQEGVPELPTATVEDGRALVNAAHDAGLPLYIHANRKGAQRYAVDIGADVIVHGMWRNPDEPAALDEEARAVLAAIADEGIGYQPTTQVIAGLRDMFDLDYLAKPNVAEVYPASLTDWYGSEFGPRIAEAAQAVGAERVAFFGETIGRATEVSRVLHEADARLLFGSDTPSDLIYTNPAGMNGRLEMDHWISAGVSEETLFRTMTIENARMLGLDDEIGTVESGKTANLLLLGADPLAGVEAYDTIEIVFLHGRPIARELLSARNAAR